MADSADDMETDGSRLSQDLAREVREMNIGSSTAKPTEEGELLKYNISSNGRKQAIIINIKTFSKTTKLKIPDRENWKVDEDVITCLLEETLGFDILTKHDCTLKDLNDLFAELRTWDFKHVGVMAVVLMSYGDNRAIYTSDGETVDINDLLENLKGKACPDLAGKPKIVFINAGTWEETAQEVDDTGYDEADACVFKPESASVSEEKKICVPKECDFMYVYSPVTFGHQKRGQVEQGNIFLTALSEMCLKLHGEALEFCDLLTRTNRQVAYRVSSTSNVPSRPCFFLSTLTKELYLLAKT